jgi:uncharacterized protein (DUF1330 family)
MSAFVIMIRNRTDNPAELAQYAEMAKAARPGHELTPRAFYGDLQALEGDAAEGVAVLEFADMQAARAWYDSPAYQAALVHRKAGADCRVLLVDGVR